MFLNGSYRTQPRFSIVTCSSPRCLVLASVEGVYMHTKSMKMCSCVVVIPSVEGSTGPNTV